MYVIHKLTLQPFISDYRLPLDAEFLHVDWQRGELCLWYRVSCDDEGVPSGAIANFDIRVLPTGYVHRNAGEQHIGSAYNPETGLIFHVFHGGTNAIR